MVRRLVALVRASRQARIAQQPGIVRSNRQAREGRPELDKGRFPIARHHPLTGLPVRLGDLLQVVRRLKVVRIVRHRAIRGRARPGQWARGVRVVAHRVVVVRLGRAMDGHKMGMDAPVDAPVIAGLHPADQLVGRAAQRLRSSPNRPSR